MRRGGGGGGGDDDVDGTAGKEAPGASYAAILCRLKQLRDSGGSAKALADCARELEAARRAVRAARKARPTPADPAVAHAEYPAPSDVPLDADGFAVAFPSPAAPGVDSTSGAAAAAKAFFAERGWVVFEGALSRAACAATRDEVQGSAAPAALAPCHASHRPT